MKPPTIHALTTGHLWLGTILWLFPSLAMVSIAGPGQPGQKTAPAKSPSVATNKDVLYVNAHLEVSID